MKIYCSKNNPTIDDFIGKDVWVKCYRSDRYDFKRLVYVNLYDKLGEDHYYGKNISANVIDDMRTVFDQYMDVSGRDDVRDFVEGEPWEFPAKLELFKPIEIITHDELLDMLGDEE